MQFDWDEDKARTNFTKHHVLFETATLVFDDPYAITRFDPVHSDEEQRLVTLGLADWRTVLFVVHTYRLESGEDSIRIISARRASAKERRKYEEAHVRAEGKSSRHSKDQRRGY